MSESLLSFSEVILFGQLVSDLQIPARDSDHRADAATVEELNAGEFKGLGPIDGVNLQAGDKVLVHLQKKKNQNGLYTVQDDNTNTWDRETVLDKGTIVHVKARREPAGELYNDTYWKQMTAASDKQIFKEVPAREGQGLGQNSQLDRQLGNDARFARIYAFAYEGTFYELPNPTLFLVHGDGQNATEIEVGNPPALKTNAPGELASRAPNKPALSGVAAADFQIANNIRIWRYDKADYTIRMDVASGMFEQVLLDLFFEVDLPMMAGAKVSGAKVSGAKVAGAKVAGAKVSGAKVAGAKVSGAKVGGFGD